MNALAFIIVPEWLVIVIIIGCVLSLVGTVAEMLQERRAKKSTDRLAEAISKYLEKKPPMKPMQYDIERHTPARLANAYRVAADAAERNPFLSPDERIKRAKAFRKQARGIESRIANGDVK